MDFSHRIVVHEGLKAEFIINYKYFDHIPKIESELRSFSYYFLSVLQCVAHPLMIMIAYFATQE